jgi:hypothetical protein
MNCARCNKEIIKRRGNVRYCSECKLIVEKEWKLRIHKKWYAKFKYSPKYFEQLEKKKLQKRNN